MKTIPKLNPKEIRDKLGIVYPDEGSLCAVCKQPIHLSEWWHNVVSYPKINGHYVGEVSIHGRCASDYNPEKYGKG